MPVPKLQMPPPHGRNYVRQLGGDTVEKAKAGIVAMQTQWAEAGLWSDAKNRWGENIARYAYFHTSAQGAAPGWIQRAKSRGRGVMDESAASIYQAAISDDRAQIDAAILELAKRMQAGYVSEVQAGGLVDTGDLRGAIDYQTPTRPRNRTWTVTRFRAKRRFAKMSEAQQLYQLYHKGRSRTMTLLRQEMPYAQFRERYAARWNVAYREHIAAALARRDRVARAANRSSTPGRVNSSRAAMLRRLLGDSVPARQPARPRRRIS